MAKADLLGKSDDALRRQMRMFKENIGAQAALLGLTPEQLAAQAADAEYFNYVVTCQQQMLNAAPGFTALRRHIRSGTGEAASQSQVAPEFPAPVAPVAPGVEKRFRRLLRQIKTHPNYTTAIGIGLGIEASEHWPPDRETLKPKLTLAPGSNNRVRIGWDWQGKRAYLDQCEIQVDRGDGRGFVPLLFATVPGSFDPLPIPPTPARWTYRAIYRVGDEPFGQWSDMASILVGA